jgi:hypothetical protein
MPIDTLLIDFAWRRDQLGYELRPVARRAFGGTVTRREPRIVRRGGELEWIRPFDMNRHAVIRFANLADRGDADVVAFISEFGPLTEHGNDPNGVSITDVRAAAAQMKAELQLAGDIRRSLTDPNREWRGTEFAKVSVRVVHSPQDGGLRIALAPANLFEGLRLQIAMMIAEQRGARACEQCGTWFDVGGDGKRADARFCSDRCRVTFHNLQRSTAARNAKEPKR